VDFAPLRRQLRRRSGRIAVARFVGVLVVLLALAACKPPPPTLDPAADPIARGFFDEVRTGGDLDADPHLAHELKNPTTEQQLAEFRALIPAEPYRSETLKSWEASDDNVGTTTKLTHVYDYGDHVLIVQTALFKSPGGVEPVIVGFNLRAGDAAS
jgi:hypothetical protein